MKRICVIILLLGFLFAGCGSQQPQRYTITYLSLFDTVTTVVATGMTQEEFRQHSEDIYEELFSYHRLFDIYNEYEGINNLKTVNDMAGVAPVQVEEAIVALLLYCKDSYAMTQGKVNAAMGSVLKLWHEARKQGLENPQNAALPEAEALLQAQKHMNFDSVIIDETACTVYITDSGVSLDVGAIAKGWAAQQVAESAPEGMLISIGGNVCVTGPKFPDGTPWIVGIQNPDENGAYLQKIGITQGAVVTSGDYQRTYTVEGKAYHHIIDPQTAMPAGYWRSVTVVCGNSALADALSTALFLLPLDEGKALAQSCDVHALWLSADGEQYMTDGFRNLLR